MRLMAIGALVLAISAFPAAAQHGHGHGPSHHGLAAHVEHMADLLDLTSEQRDRVRGILGRHHEATADLSAELPAADDRLRAAIHAAEFDENAIRDASREVGSIRTELAVARASLFHEMRGVLNGDQLERLDQLQEEGFGGMQRPGPGFHGRRPAPPDGNDG